MKKMRCETIWAYGFILLAMTLLPLAGFGREEATPTPAVEQTWQALVEAARAEGKLVISSNSLHESLPQAFEKKYGIRTILEASSGREATNRLLAERRAGIHAVDIFIAGRGTMRSRLLPAGVLGSIPDLLINPEVVDQSLWREGHWYGDPDQKYVFFFAMNASSDNAYNTNLVDPKDVRSWWDLLDPRWRGKIIASHPVRRPGTEATRAWLYTHPDLGPDYIRRIYTETGMKLVATDREMANGIATGAFAILFLAGNVGQDIDQMERDGFPVSKWRTPWKEGTTISPGGDGSIAVIEPAANPNAQKLFLNWFLSREGQQIYNNRPNADRESLRVDVTPNNIPSHYRLPEGRLHSLDARPDITKIQQESEKFIRSIVNKHGL